MQQCRKGTAAQTAQARKKQGQASSSLGKTNSKTLQPKTTMKGKRISFIAIARENTLAETSKRSRTAMAKANARQSDLIRRLQSGPRHCTAELGGQLAKLEAAAVLCHTRPPH